MEKKFRILIYVIMERRDIGASYVLSRLLEHMGCECYVAGTNTYCSKSIVWWKPHAVVFGTINRAKILNRVYPRSLLFYYPSEGGESYEFSLEKRLAEDKDTFDKISKIYLWGVFAKNHILRRAMELGDKSFLYGRKSLLDEKCDIIGHPRLDLIRYIDNTQKQDGYTRVGLVGSFNILNSVQRLTPIYRVFNGGASDEMLFQSSLLSTYGKIIQTLDPTRYKISIRPYPLEDIEQYLKTRWVRDGRLEVDSSLEFGAWASQQDLLIGPTSSTLSQIAMAKQPFINLDVLNKRSMTAYKNSIRDVFIKHTAQNCPRTFEELFSMIRDYKKLYVKSLEFDQVMDDVYNSGEPRSFLWRVAKDIVRVLKERPPRITKGIPRKVFEKIQALRFREDPTSYSHFLYTEKKKRLNDELGAVVENIVANEKENRK